MAEKSYKKIASRRGSIRSERRKSSVSKVEEVVSQIMDSGGTGKEFLLPKIEQKEIHNILENRENGKKSFVR